MLPQLRDCFDCRVKPGELHVAGCESETCPLCNHQMISCSCVYKVNEIDAAEYEETHEGPSDEMWAKFDQKVEEAGGFLPWLGEPYGAKECRERGWWVRFNEKAGIGWVACEATDPAAHEDLNRWAGSLMRHPEFRYEISK